MNKANFKRKTLGVDNLRTKHVLDLALDVFTECKFIGDFAKYVGFRRPNSYYKNSQRNKLYGSHKIDVLVL